VLFCGATWIGAKSWRDWLSACLLYLPLAGMFGFFVLDQLPFLWPHLLLWALAIAIGLSLLAARLNRKARISAVVILFAISAWYCVSYIPARMKAGHELFWRWRRTRICFSSGQPGSGPHDGDVRENFGHRFLRHLVSTLYRRAARNCPGQGEPTKQARHRICCRGYECRWRHTRTPARLRPAAARYPSPRFRSGKKSARRIWFERISRNSRY